MDSVFASLNMLALNATDANLPYSTISLNANVSKVYIETLDILTFDDGIRNEASCIFEARFCTVGTRSLNIY